MDREANLTGIERTNAAQLQAIEVANGPARDYYASLAGQAAAPAQEQSLASQYQAPAQQQVQSYSAPVSAPANTVPVNQSAIQQAAARVAPQPTAVAPKKPLPSAARSQAKARSFY